MADSTSTGIVTMPIRFAGGSVLGIGTWTGSTYTPSTSTGAGNTINLRAGYATFAVQVISASTEAHEVNLEGALDGTNFVTLGSTGLHTSTANTIVKSTSATPVQYVRCNVVTNSTSGIVAFISAA